MVLKIGRKFVIVLVLLLALSLEVDARRKILRGRKTVNRTYLRAAAIPSYVIVILVAIGQMIIGGLFYVILKLCILDKPISPRYQAAPVHSRNGP
ncbi:uncharacterized protein LOC114329075 [Diabrotica virgifera virgifera]|uniref:Uncharacterized protein LOC114329075 n=1 Tax=Diabrotica virgifera virgifera TaxID=50390 RepID=A0A6P7FLB7_DIAVI|nr:uncharacterized protein LOC114329075 [Diabrotica virgifera virgifera]